jgi:mRNA deadenylase 3'-5' endonuclease subunit Ccr4
LLKDDPCNNPAYRNRRILAEIEQSQPDILCLQEVTLKHTYAFFAHELENMGYEICATKYVEEEILSHGHQET